MQLWTPIPDVAATPLLLATALASFTLLAALGDGELTDEGQTWGDDPAVLAMLSGMSL
jgi:hypothetical protein